jgi:hypothetical protein
MPIPFSCPHCGAQTVVSDEFAGHSGPCFQCGRTITVPGRPPVAGGGHRTAASAGRSPLPGWAIGLAALVVVVVGGGALLTAFLAPAASASREAADRATCADRLQRIGVALSEYDQARFRLPNVAEEVRGEPVSWRVLILPSMEYGGVYQKYRMDEPWDGPSNRALAAIEMTDYHCPSDAQSPGNQANYLAVVGERTILQQQKRTSLRRVEDGTSNTIMVTELHDQ